MNELDRGIMEVLEGYKSAVYDRNVDAFVSLYDEESRVFDAWEVWSYEGIAARRGEIEGWMGSLGAERVIVTFDDVRSSSVSILAVVTAFGTFAAIAKDGTELRSMQNRFTWGLKWNGSTWKIIHEHTSVPIQFSDMQGILHRKKAS